MPTDAQNGPTQLYSPHVFNARSRARFSRNRTAALLCHLGRDPSVPERILIARTIALEWELLKIDRRIEGGEELSAHALRARLAAENRLRLDLQSIGLKPPQPPPMSVAERIAAAVAAAKPDHQQ